jgi:hypothetical protein
VGRETRCPSFKEEILEEMVAKSTDIDFLKSDETSLTELTNSEFCKTEEELVPLAGQTKSVTSTDVGSPRESEAEDSSVSSKDQLRARVYSLLREVAHVPLSSPPRLKKTETLAIEDSPSSCSSSLRKVAS